MAGRNSVEIILSASDRASGVLRGAFGEIESANSRVMGAIKGGAVIAGAAFAALGGYIAKTGIDYDAMQEQSQVAWTTLLGSQDKAKKQLQDIATFAKNTPFETESVDMMAKYMNNAGLAGKGLFDELMRVSDVASAFNIPAESAQELTRQMSQVRQAGVAYTEDLNVLQDRGVPIFQALAKEMGTNVANVKKMASEGKITSDVYVKAFDGVADKVKGASDAQSKTWNGMLSTVSDNLKIISGTLMQGTFTYMKQSLDKVMPILDKFSSTLKDKGLKAALSEIIGKDQVDKFISFFNTVKEQGTQAFKLLKDAVLFTINNFNTLEPILAGVLATIVAYKVISTVTKLIEAWRAASVLVTAAQWALNVALDANPIGLVIIAIGALVAAGVLLYQNWDTVKAKMSAIWMVIEQGAASMVNGIIGSLNWLIDKINVVASVFGTTIPKISKVDWGSITAKPGTAPMGNGVVHGRTSTSYASGTDFHPGGIAMVGENGPELVDLPRGSKVYTTSETKRMLSGGKGNTYNLKVINNQNMDEQTLIQWMRRMEALNP